MSEFLMQRSHIFPPLVKEQHVENNCIVQSLIWQLQNEAQADTKKQESALWGEKGKEKTVLVLLCCSPDYTLFFSQISSSLVPGIITTIVFSEAEESKGLRKPLCSPEQGSSLLTLLLSLASVREQLFPDIQATD